MSLKDISVLYLDDEEVNLFLFNANFKSRFDVLTASSATEAFELLESNSDKIIVVISDMRMPGMNGVEFVKKARENYSNIFYYILTAFDFSEEIQRALDEKLIHKSFKKPFDVKEIEEEVKEAARSFNKK